MTIVGDGAFLASLARTREGAMRDIVATIQREQDEVIRAPADGTVLVRGAPGTGKTAVALHRVAYLLFRHRRRFGSRGVLVIGPNRRFTAYIERVLPSLGEGSATLRSLGDLVEGVTATVHDPPETARVKGAGAMAAVLRRAVADHPPGAPDELRVVHKGVVVTLDRARLDRIRTELHRRGRGSVNAARGRAAEMLLDALWERFTDIGGPEAAEAEEGAEAGLWNAILAADGLASLDDEPARGGRKGNGDPKRGQFDARVREQRAFTDFLVSWWPIRRPLDVLRSLGDPARLRRAAGRDLDRAAVEPVAASWAGDDAPLSYQDVALLDELDALLGPPPRPSRRRTAPSEDDPFVVDGVNILTGEEVVDDTWEPEMQELTTSIERVERSRRVDDGVVEERPEYAHIVVDEAQDLSPCSGACSAAAAARPAGRSSRTPRRAPGRTWTPPGRRWRPRSAASGRPGAAAAPARRRPRAARVRADDELPQLHRDRRGVGPGAGPRAAGRLPARAVRTSGIDPIVSIVPEHDLASAAREAAEELLGQVDGTIGVIVPLPGRAAGGPEVPVRPFAQPCRLVGGRP